MKINKMLVNLNRVIRANLMMDVGKLDDLIILSGMGRSGTTWAADIINYDHSYRVLFEPFFPAKVRAARGFDYIQYLDSACCDALLVKGAKIILSGKVRNYWVNKNNAGAIYHRRIVKDIRTNLMLAWLKKQSNNAPTILMIRHPLQVVSSWLKLGWGTEALGNRNDFNIITSQQPLLNDFPIVKEVMKHIDQYDLVEKTVFQWCVFQLVPLQQLKNGEAYTLFYENLLLDPYSEIKKLFQYLGKTFSPQQLQTVISRSSHTNYLNRDFNNDQSLLLNSWKNEFSQQQIQRANYILESFGLNTLYNSDGYPTTEKLFRIK